MIRRSALTLRRFADRSSLACLAAILVVILSTVGAHACASGADAGPDTVVVRSGSLRLRAVIYRPPRSGPYPAILFLHGSGHASGIAPDGTRDHRHPELLGPVFAKHGYLFLYLFRRGDGLSGGQGTPCGDLMDRAYAKDGEAGRNRAQIRLLEGDEMADARAGLAFLRSLRDVAIHRIAVVGHSFGGTLSVLLAAREPSVRAVVAFSPGGYSWERSPELRTRLRAAVADDAAPVFFIHASNDYTTAPGESLAAEMQRSGGRHRIKIYPPVGRSAADGHDFIHLRVSVWEPDVFSFLDEHTGVPK